jgi:hypothetical protein
VTQKVESSCPENFCPTPDEIAIKLVSGHDVHEKGLEMLRNIENRKHIGILKWKTK